VKELMAANCRKEGMDAAIVEHHAGKPPPTFFSQFFAVFPVGAFLSIFQENARHLVVIFLH
jgi:hypothetical protein